MSLATKAAALLVVLRRQDVEQLPPFERQRLADLCRRVIGLAEAKSPEPKSGVLVELAARRRDE